MRLTDLLTDYVLRHPSTSRATEYQYLCTLRVFSRHLGRDPTVADLTVVQVGGFLRAMLDDGRSGRTVNSKRQQLLTLWRHADDSRLPIPEQPPSHRRLGKARVVERVPAAWTEEEMDRLLSACEAAPEERGWSGRHWAGLVSTAYDTCRRIGALLAAKRCDVEWGRQTLFIPGEHEKGRACSRSQLSHRTLWLLRQLPESDLLFDWPFCRRQLHIRFKRHILEPAGLPSGRRDKFQRIRRSSYTFVARELGILAATQHASHKSDLSSFYLDRSQLREPRPIDVLPDIGHRSA